MQKLWLTTLVVKRGAGWEEWALFLNGLELLHWSSVAIIEGGANWDSIWIQIADVLERVTGMPVTHEYQTIKSKMLEDAGLHPYTWLWNELYQRIDFNMDTGKIELKPLA